MYKNAFARRDIIKEKYAAFAKDDTKKVNAGTLYPYEVVEKALRITDYGWGNSETDRAMVNKYWDNLTDYFNGANLNALAMWIPLVHAWYSHQCAFLWVCIVLSVRVLSRTIISPLLLVLS